MRGRAGDLFAVGFVTTYPITNPPTPYFPACYTNAAPGPGSAWIGLWEPDDEGVPSLVLHAEDITAQSGSFMIRGVAIDDDLPGDLNCDGCVDGGDLGLLLTAWGTAGPGDLNGDGVVDGVDLGIVLAAWGACR